MQNVLASLASQVTTPRSSSGRPMRPNGFKLAHLSSRCGCVSRYAAVMLQKRNAVSFSRLKASLHARVWQGATRQGPSHRPKPLHPLAVSSAFMDLNTPQSTPGSGANRASPFCVRRASECRGAKPGACENLNHKRANGDALCVDVPGAERVHAYALRAKLAGHAACHLQHGRLGRVV